MNSDKVSLILVTKNSGGTLERCLKSVQGFVSEIVLVDDDSCDTTLQIAEKFGAKIFKRKLDGFGAQKQYALDQAINDWVFLIDSDETASPELLEEMGAIIRGANSLPAYKAARRNFHFGKWLKFGGKYPDYQVRLFKKSAVTFSNHIVHEKLVVNGKTGVLRYWINHFSYPDMGTWIEKLKMFSDKRADELYRAGARPSLFNALRFCFFKPLWRFYRRYFIKLGLLDGLPGFLACVHDALTEILTYSALAAKTNRNK